MKIYPIQQALIENASPLDLDVLACLRFALEPSDREVFKEIINGKEILVFPTPYSFLESGGLYWWQEGQKIDNGGTHLRFYLAILTSSEQKELFLKNE